MTSLHNGSSSSANNTSGGMKRKRPLSSTKANEEEDTRTSSVSSSIRNVGALGCSFPLCSKPAAVRIATTSNRTAAVPTPLCLLHYYTSDHVRMVPPNLVESIPQATAQQLPHMQQLFASVFVELQQQLAQETARQSNIKNNDRASSSSHKSYNKSDPLAVLHALHHPPAATSLKRGSAVKLKKPPPPSTSQNHRTEGGFMRPEVLPERLSRTQHEQAQYHDQLLRRMKRAGTESSKEELSRVPNPPRSATERRRTSRKSIWNAVLEDRSCQRSSSQHAQVAALPVELPTDDSTADGGMVCSSCGSVKVSTVGTHSSRNDEQRKGETWGSKDRSDQVWTRYQCQLCGKVWNEEE